MLLFFSPIQRAVGFLVLSFIGLADASYLSVAHLKNTSPGCFLTIGCDVVTTSSFSDVLGIPLAYIGVVYFLVVFFLSVAFLDQKKIIFLQSAALLALGGFAISLVLVGLQLFVLEAICIYCMISAGVNTLLALLGLPLSRP